ncbi:chemotaxis protein CheW [Massilia sp. SM-13]|uniref:chemotaxis protein CheW n=1 Tax=Pseudoduganella rhizocola TaxID=3382643 RepID=UPI0038B46074
MQAHEQLPMSAAAHQAATAMAAARAAAARVLEEARGMELFGSFMLNGQEFAISAPSIREVVSMPDAITPMPLSPAYLEGFFTLRGAAIPVVNLGRIFNPASPAAHGGQKIAILDHEEVQVGLLFDATGEVLRVRPEQRSSVQCAASVINGAILLNDGARLIQVLDASALIRIDNVPQVRSMGAAARAADRSRFLRHAEGRKCISFSAGGASFAMPMEAVQEIIPVQEFKSSVMLSRLCLGWINFRGDAVGIVDFAALMQCERAAEAQEPRILVLRMGSELLGFLVDSVDDVRAYFEGDILAIPMLGTRRAAMFRGCLPRTGGRDTLFLDHGQIFEGSELREISAGHRRLYQQEASAAAEHAARHAAASRRQVYLAFCLGAPWAADISSVREIIPCARDLARPPGTPECVRGILQLRQQMISVIDLRILYGMPALEDMSEARILVLEQGEERYGVIVDKVDSILSVADSDRRPSPALLRSGGAPDDMRSEVVEVLDIEGENGRQVRSIFSRDHFFATLKRKLEAA